MLFPCVCDASNTFSFLSANLNGFGDAYKLSLASNIILNHRPLAAVLSETKSAAPAAHMLDLPGYTLYENPGMPASRAVGKWGIVVALRKGFQLKRRLEIPLSLRARVIALDIIITSPRPRVLRLVGIYAPWDVGDPSCLTFWNDIQQVIMLKPHNAPAHDAP